MILTDAQIRSAFESVATHGHTEFLTHYARAVLAADHADFYILRPVSLVLIQKYKLGGEK